VDLKTLTLLRRDQGDDHTASALGFRHRHHLLSTLVCFERASVFARCNADCQASLSGRRPRHVEQLADEVTEQSQLVKLQLGDHAWKRCDFDLGQRPGKPARIVAGS
jgi:hypothetical protein